MSAPVYLLIENPGVASVEAFTLLGASNKAGTDAIGQFGSGTKFGVLSLLREGINPVIYCGLTRVEFFTKTKVFDGAEHQQVCVKLSGKTADNKSVNRTEELSLVLRYGEIDWKDIRLALREFVSNALDAVNGDATQVTVDLVTTAKAKAGATRVYVPVQLENESATRPTDAGAKTVLFKEDIAKWFLHFAPNGVWRSTKIIRKPSPTNARIYRRGVLVREVPKLSLFDYNLNDLPLDEARVANDWSVKHQAGKAVQTCADKDVYAAILNADKPVWELEFTLHDVFTQESTATKAARDAAWAAAANSLLGDDVVLVHENGDASVAEAKGYKVKKVKDSVYAAASARKLRTIETILTADERNGRQVDADTNPLAASLVASVWNRLEALGVTHGETAPAVKSFSASGIGTKGYWRDGTVFINNAVVGETYSAEAFATALEECAHHITKATDNSRDFQEFFIQIAVKFLHG